MADRAHILSSEALDRFRIALINYRERAAAALHEMGDEVRRTRNWVQQDRVPHWNQELHRRGRLLDDARQRLFSAELSALRDSAGEEKRQVLRWHEAVREAEEKLRLARKWDQNFDSAVGPLAKQVDNLRLMVDDELPRAIQALGLMIEALERYADVQPSREDLPPPP
ncbi:MAG: hypothetical protein DVB23_002392 [Verrucomicrobia bacterium]|jgi:hypothetical protein|nr:MAG: hypothetical protein DVB23_002392 [Verrucomicrobiota bacterium]